MLSYKISYKNSIFIERLSWLSGSSAALVLRKEMPRSTVQIRVGALICVLDFLAVCSHGSENDTSPNIVRPEGRGLRRMLFLGEIGAFPRSFTFGGLYKSALGRMIRSERIL